MLRFSKTVIFGVGAATAAVAGAVVGVLLERRRSSNTVQGDQQSQCHECHCDGGCCGMDKESMNDFGDLAEDLKFLSDEEPDELSEGEEEPYSIEQSPKEFILDELSEPLPHMIAPQLTISHSMHDKKLTEFMSKYDKALAGCESLISILDANPQILMEFDSSDIVRNLKCALYEVEHSKFINQARATGFDWNLSLAGQGLVTTLFISFHEIIKYCGVIKALTRNKQGRMRNSEMGFGERPESEIFRQASELDKTLTEAFVLLVALLQ